MLNILNQLISIMSSRFGVELLRAVNKRRNGNKGWMFLSVFSVGALVAVLARRIGNGDSQKPMQNFINSVQQGTSQSKPSSLNLAHQYELAEEMLLKGRKMLDHPNNASDS